MNARSSLLVAALVAGGILLTALAQTPPNDSGLPKPRPKEAALGESGKADALPQPIATADISLVLAHAALEAAAHKAEAIGTKMNIAVVDAGGNLKAFIRMDGAWLGSIDIAIRKARTARYFDMPTGEIGKLSVRSSEKTSSSRFRRFSANSSWRSRSRVAWSACRISGSSGLTFMR